MSTSTTLTIHAVQRFCVQDGPGIRTVVFLQGCPLRCWWCHNPAMQPESPGGTPRRVETLVREVERDARYWVHSGGGVTLSGGEPLLQADGGASFLAALKAHGYHCCVETAGFGPAASISLLDVFTSLWLFDLKTVNGEAFHRACGGDLKPVLSNLRTLLHRRAASVWVRIPLIRGYNDDSESLDGIAGFLADLPTPARIQLLPGHGIGVAGSVDPTVEASVCRKAETMLRRADNPVEVCW